MAFACTPHPSAADAARVDVIGDVHGCRATLGALLSALGYTMAGRGGAPVHPGGRIAVFVGDLVDRGPAPGETLRLVDAMVAAGSGAIGAIGNHDWRLWRAVVARRPVPRGHGLAETLEALAVHDPGEVRALVDRLFGAAPSHSLWAGGALAVTHAALPAAMAGARPAADRGCALSEVCMYGETTGPVPPYGIGAARTYGWVESWRGRETTVVFGHDVLGPSPVWPAENVVGIDTGCAGGGSLSALRFPEHAAVSVACRPEDLAHAPEPVAVAA